MAQQIGTLAKSPEDLRVIPGTHVAKGENLLLGLSLTLQGCVCSCPPLKVNIFKNKDITK